MNVELIGASLIAGAVGGAIYGVSGYYKANSTSIGEVDFEFGNFFVSVVGAATVGAFSAYQGLPYDAVANGAMGVAITQFVRKIYGIIKAKYTAYVLNKELIKLGTSVEYLKKKKK